MYGGFFTWGIIKETFSMRFMLMDNPAKQLEYSSIEEMCRWGEAEERRNAGYGRTKIVMQIIKSNVRRKV